MNDLYKQILDNINLIIVVKDSLNNVIYCNHNDGLELIKLNDKKKSRIKHNGKSFHICYYDFDDKKIEIYQDISLFDEKILKLKKDYLTNLFNRHAIFEKLETINDKSIENNSIYSIAIGDIDFFKKVNDEYGHLVGDKVLRGVSDILVQKINDIGLVGRLGGEEFIIILPNTTKEASFDVIEKIRKEVESTKVRVKYNDCVKEFFISITFGLALSNVNKTSIEIIEEADKALYKGKNAGRNQTNFL